MQASREIRAEGMMIGAPVVSMAAVLFIGVLMLIFPDYSRLVGFSLVGVLCLIPFGFCAWYVYVKLNPPLVVQLPIVNRGLQMVDLQQQQLREKEREELST
ncbi:hypothetical protein AMTRI_Chr03g53140 [Amborella trichopoda]|uniref:Uncharacterized protein n=1 Tax=Amborella trichopoda TaxID=13333 RepID=W1P2Q1_AMBTC|nr:hypothetical protein AMTR_s00002p00239220 [Amborella trichopoda]